MSLEQLPGVTAQRPEIGAVVTASWDDTTVADTAATVTTTNFQQVVGTLDLDGTAIATGVLTFEASWDGGTIWAPIGAYMDWATQSQVYLHDLDLTWLDPSYPLLLTIPCVGATHARVRLSTVLTGTTPTADLRLIPTTAPFAPLPLPSILATNAGGSLSYLQSDLSGQLYVVSAASSQADGHSATLGSTNNASYDNAGGAASVISILKTAAHALGLPSTATYGGGGNLTVLSALKAMYDQLASLISKFPSALVGGRLDVNNGTWLGSTAPTIGQKTMANSVPMVLASDQSALPVASHAVTNAGTFVTQENGGALTALQLIDDTIIVDDAAFTPGTTKVSMIGLQADETSTDSIDEGDAGAPRMTLDRRQIVVPQPHAAGGLSIFRSIDLDEGALEVVKASPGAVYGMWVTNTATASRWIKFYDATSGTYGTGTPVITIGIPGNTSDDIAGNFGPGGIGVQFATGISVGAGTGVADNDTGAPGANDVVVNIFYK